MREALRTGPIFLAIMALSMPGLAQGEFWELRPVEGDAVGTELIAAGRIEEAIQVLASALQRGTGGDGAALRANLCIAYALKLEYSIAMRYCDQATVHPQAGATSFNNRGVVRAVTGDERGAARDFRRATCMRSCRHPCNESAESVVSVARRNLNRVQQANPAVGPEVVPFQPSL